MKKIISFSLMILFIFTLIGCKSSRYVSQDSSNIAKSENKESDKNKDNELNNFIEQQDIIIKKEEAYYNNLIDAMNNKSKIDTNEKVNYNYNVIAEELHQVHESAKDKDFYNLVKLHIEQTRAYSYSMSEAVMFISIKGNKDWGTFSFEDELANSINSVSNKKDVYYLSKDRMLNKEQP